PRPPPPSPPSPYTTLFRSHEGLIDHAHLRADGHQVVELLDVFRVQPDATVARAQPDSGRLVGAVDQVTRPLQIESVLAEGVLGAGADDRIEILAVVVVLLAHRLGYAPGGILLPAHDLRDALRSAPTHLADADGMSDDDRPLAALDRRIVEDAHRGDVDDEPGTRRIRQDELRRNHDLAAFPGE